MYEYIYLINPELLNKVKIGYWSGTISALKSRYKMYYGLFEIYIFQCDGKSNETFILKYFNEKRWLGELFDKEIICEFMKIMSEISYNSCKSIDMERNFIKLKYLKSKEIENTLDEEFEDLDEEDIIFNHTVSGNKKIDKLLKLVILKDLDRDSCLIIHELYKDQFKTCNNIWFEFINSKWIKIEKHPIEIDNCTIKIIEYLNIIKENNKKNRYSKNINHNINMIKLRISKKCERAGFCTALVKYFNDKYFIDSDRSINH